MKWQSLETAPKDGTFVLVAHMDGQITIRRHHERTDHWLDDEDFYMTDNHPTHWMPLPPPPETTK